MKERRTGQSEYRRQAAIADTQLRFLSSRPHSSPKDIKYTSNRKFWIHRPVSEDVFKSIFQVVSETFGPQTWRKAPSPLHVTMVQPYRQLLPSAFDTLEASEVSSYLTEHIPSIAHPITLAINGLCRRGSEDAPYAAVGFSDKRLEFERAGLCQTIGNQWATPEFKWPRFRPHISLAQAYTNRDAQSIMRTIRPLLPDEIQLEPVEVVMGTPQPQPTL